jgi:hypothetical protein
MKIYYKKFFDLFSLQQNSETKILYGNEVNVKVESTKHDINKDTIKWIKIRSHADNYWKQIDYTNDFKITVSSGN